MHLCHISTSVNIFDFYFTILSLFKFQHPFISLLNWFRRLIKCFFPTFNVTSYTFLHLSKLFPLLPLYANLHLLLGFFSPSIYASNSPPSLLPSLFLSLLLFCAIPSSPLRPSFHHPHYFLFTLPLSFLPHSSILQQLLLVLFFFLTLPYILRYSFTSSSLLILTLSFLLCIVIFIFSCTKLFYYLHLSSLFIQNQRPFEFSWLNSHYEFPIFFTSLFHSFYFIVLFLAYLYTFFFLTHPWLFTYITLSLVFHFSTILWVCFSYTSVYVAFLVSYSILSLPLTVHLPRKLSLTLCIILNFPVAANGWKLSCAI